LDDVKAFLDQHLEETSVLEYTEIGSEKDFQGVMEIISAMANTDGGIILIGVSKDQKSTNKPGKLVGIDPIFRDSLKNKYLSLLQPAFVPEIVPVDIPENKACVFLLIRINPEIHPRPVVLRGKGILARVGDRNQPADLYQLVFETTN
jgi:predicted HTH transcriptional regulator